MSTTRESLSERSLFEFVGMTTGEAAHLSVNDPDRFFRLMTAEQKRAWVRAAVKHGNDGNRLCEFALRILDEAGL